VARNCEGIVSATVTLRENIKTSPLMAEAMGVRWCLKWIKEMVPICAPSEKAK